MSLIKCTICTVNVFVIFLPQLFLFLVSKPNKSFSFTQIDQSKSVRKPASSKVPVFNTPKSQIYEPAGAVIASRFKKKRHQNGPTNPKGAEQREWNSLSLRSLITMCPIRSRLYCQPFASAAACSTLLSHTGIPFPTAPHLPTGRA